MPVVFLITIAAVLVGIFFAATGRGGELAYEHADHAPLDLGPVSAADVALLRPPTALWGYNMQVTDEALDHIARAMRERDVTIAYLREQLTSYERNGSYTEPKGAHVRPGLDAPLASELPPFPGMTWTTEAPEAPEALESPEAPQPPETPETHEPPEAPDALEPPESPEPLVTAEPPDSPMTTEPPAATQAPKPPQTSLILRASGSKPPPAPEPHEATQPSQTLPPDETQGPQGAFDTHGWWAEQEQAAREERARPRAPGDQEAPGDKGTAGSQYDDSLAAVEEQGW